MTQRKEKTGICKSVVIATVVAIRDVVKNGFHCIIGDRYVLVELSLHDHAQVVFALAFFFFQEELN